MCDGSWIPTRQKRWRFPRNPNGELQVRCSQTSTLPSIVSSLASQRVKACSFARCARKGNANTRPRTISYQLSTLRYKLKVLSPDLPEGDHPRIDLSYPDALKYLRGEALTLPADTPRSIVTVTYKGIPLGPVKNIGNRANNLYPKPWRIKTTHLPSEEIKIIDIQ